ncbi:mitochondrial glycoprotein [Xylariomycetidae sp. FL2044]|nr:mitochondrial glycoprotein [Xylariomycetidae sp. FL2044]
MMSLRAAARSAPRALTRLSSVAIRQSRVAQPSSLVKSSWAPLRSSQLSSSFSTSPSRQSAPAETPSEVNDELSEKLEMELNFESEMKKQEPLPASVKDFLDSSPFEIKDVPGKEDIYLTRQFGNENITISFSISDLANYEPENAAFNEEDSALTDEELATPEGKRLAEQEAEEQMEGEEDPETPVPCRLNIVIEKLNKGALNIEALAQDGQIVVENFYYYSDPKLAHSTDPEAVHEAEETYPGPPFVSLDEDLQILMERYLEERGITQALAVFVPDYMDVKEQREYSTWLKNVKDFVDA